MALRFALNGLQIVLDDIDPHVTLLEWLRASGHSGTKEGCAEGECGACAVALIDQDHAGRGCFTAINSCLLPLPSVHGRSLVTVEGIAAPSGELHPVQSALVEHGGSQCGYCTPGFVVSLFCEYYSPDRTGYDPEAISGNLCRCTGYRPIIDAARTMPAPDPSDARLTTLRTPPRQLEGLSLERRSRSAPANVYLRPTSLAELLDRYAAAPAATLIAGGTDLMVYKNQRDQRFDSLISLEAVPELQAFAHTPGEIVLGAALPLSRLARQLASVCPDEVAMLSQLWPLFSSRLIRNRATLGGNLATASPIGDAAPVLLALDAELCLASARGERRIPLSAFFLGYRKQALGPGELIKSVHLPRPLPRLQKFYKVSKRVLDDISTIAAAFALDLGPDGEITRLRAAYGGIAATPLRAAELERQALGQRWSSSTLRALLPVLSPLGTPLGDQRGSARYRQALVSKLFEKFYASTRAHAVPA